VGNRRWEVYRPATGLWLQLPPTVPIYPDPSEGTLIYRDTSLTDDSCIHLASLIRGLHHRLGMLGKNIYIPVQYLVDDPEWERDIDLVDMLDEL